MFTVLTSEQINWLVEGELGINSLKFIDIVNGYKNSKFVDLGVETGKSSMIFLNKAIENNNHVWGVDPIPNMGQEILDNPNYHYVNGDSVDTGNNWDNGEVDIVFVDSIHADAQVLSELYAWWDHVKEGGWIIFHDTNWANYIHKPTHPCAGKKPGNSGLGYDFYGGVAWPTPDVAVKKFFKLDTLEKDYEDEYISVTTGPESLGMTFVNKKKHYDYDSDITDWENTFSRRNHLLKSFGV